MDKTKPDAGRIYNYISGGAFHTEIDRHVADQIIALEPSARLIGQMQRQALLKTACELTQAGECDVIIDFGSGAPDHEYIHHVVPDSTTVIYSDKDAAVVDYSRPLLQGAPNVHYFQADAGRPEDLLGHPQVLEILAGRRHAAFVYWALSSFLSNEALAHAAQYLYDWSDAQSRLLFNLQTHNSRPDDPKVSQIIELFKQMEVKRYRHSIDECLRLLQPWKAAGKGFVTLFEWNDIAPGPQWGAKAPGYGAQFVK